MTAAARLPPSKLAYSQHNHQAPMPRVFLGSRSPGSCAQYRAFYKCLHAGHFCCSKDEGLSQGSGSRLRHTDLMVCVSRLQKGIGLTNDKMREVHTCKQRHKQSQNRGVRRAAFPPPGPAAPRTPRPASPPVHIYPPVPLRLTRQHTRSLKS